MNGQVAALQVQAGEYVLGLMAGADTAAFEDELRRNKAARAAVREIRERFLDIDLAAPEENAPAGLWDRIEEDVKRAEENIVALRHRDRRRQQVMGVPQGGVAVSGFWRGFAAAAVLAIISFGTVWLTVRQPQPELIVVLLDDKSQPGAIVEALGDQRIRVVPLEQFEVPEGKTLQVWTLPDARTGPVSMGLLPGTNAAILQGPELPPPQPQQLYEITVEPAGGSPTGRPTGPIVAKGFARVPQV